jgi:site-specific DNA-adenine methylase
MRYGIPYVGSKNKIAEKIIDKLPPAKHFYDLFGGGGAMTHCALLSGKYEFVHYNELNPLVFKAFKMALNGEFKNENRWISREDFERLKDSDPYIACCYSFGNDFKTYAYNKEREKFKKAVHYSIFFDDNSLLNKYIDLKDFKYSSGNIKERRLELQRYMKTNLIESLERLERLQSLERLNNVRVLLSNLSYDEVPIENDSVIYCDPPYLKVTKKKRYNNSDFNHNSFYDWARKQNNIFISEYTMPDDFEVVYQKEKRCCLGLNNNTKTVEKLFVNNGHKFAYTQNNLF